jgi:predicted transposase YbfD/YdcC
MEGFIAIFSEVEDPRAENAWHNLLDVVFIALAATLCGAENCSDMADFGEAKEPLLRQILRLEHGIPSHDTFSRVFRILDPVQFEAAFRRFLAAFAKSKHLSGVVAIDGKAVRGAYQRGKRSTPLHLVNVWGVSERLALAQYTAPHRDEVAGTLAVLKLLSLKGCIVTADALHCHRKMAQAVLDSGADYVLALKENQSALFADAVAVLDAATRRDERQQEPEADHGRSEHRSAIVVRDATLANEHNFPAIRAIARVTCVRRIEGKADDIMVRYFLLSCVLSATRLLEVVRQHWTIENQLHWVLDVVFREDAARNRKDHGPQNLAVLRKLALNALRAHPDKAALRRKVKRAGWDDTFLLSILAHLR